MPSLIVSSLVCDDFTLTTTTTAFANGDVIDMHSMSDGQDLTVCMFWQSRQ